MRGQVTDDEVIVSVTDVGQGIPLREQERIFERFQRVDNSMARRTQGAGLGPLYLSGHRRGTRGPDLGEKRARAGLDVFVQPAARTEARSTHGDFWQRCAAEAGRGNPGVMEVCNV